MTLKIVTLNAGLLCIRFGWGLWIFEPAPWVEERLRALPGVLSSLDADVIILQETYRPAHKAWIAGQLREIYPYSAYSPRHPLLRLVPDSFLVLSKYPVRDAAFVRFRAARWDEFLLDSKGYMRFDLPGTPCGDLRVASVHTTAGLATHPENPKVDRVRALQLEQVARDLAQAPSPWRTLIAGDINCGPGVAEGGVPVPDLPLAGGIVVPSQERVSMNNYRLLQEWGYRDVHATLGLPDEATWTPTGNPLNQGTHAAWGCCAQRIDGVWVRPEELKPLRGGVFLREPCVEVPGGQQVPISDHFGVWVELAKA